MSAQVSSEQQLSPRCKWLGRDRLNVSDPLDRSWLAHDERSLSVVCPTVSACLGPRWSITPLDSKLIGGRDSRLDANRARLGCWQPLDASGDNNAPRPSQSAPSGRKQPAARPAQAASIGARTDSRPASNGFGFGRSSEAALRPLPLVGPRAKGGQLLFKPSVALLCSARLCSARNKWLGSPEARALTCGRRRAARVSMAH